MIRRLTGLAIATALLGCTAERAGLKYVGDLRRADDRQGTLNVVSATTEESGRQKERVRVMYEDPLAHRAPSTTSAMSVVPIPVPDDAGLDALVYGSVDNHDSHRVGGGLQGSHKVGEGKVTVEVVGERHRNDDGSRGSLIDTAVEYKDDDIRLQLGAMWTKPDGHRESIDLRGSLTGRYGRFLAGVGGKINLDTEVRRMGFVATMLPGEPGEGLGWKFVYHGDAGGNTRIQAAFGWGNIAKPFMVQAPLGALAVNDAGIFTTNNTVGDAIVPGLLGYTKPDHPIADTIELRLDYLHNDHSDLVVPEIIARPAHVIELFGGPDWRETPVIGGLYVGGGASLFIDRDRERDVAEYVRAGIRQGGVHLAFERDGRTGEMAGRLELDLLKFYDTVFERKKD